MLEKKTQYKYKICISVATKFWNFMLIQAGLLLDVKMVD